MGHLSELVRQFPLALWRSAKHSPGSRCDKTSLLLGSTHARYGWMNLTLSAPFWVRRAWEARQGVFGCLVCEYHARETLSRSMSSQGAQTQSRKLESFL